MHIASILIDLLNSGTVFNNEMYVPYSLTEKHLQDYQNKSISWDVKDFQAVAEWKKGNKWTTFYDETRFERALVNMIKNHDPEVGITWKTVDFYLDVYCKRNIGDNGIKVLEKAENIQSVLEQ